MAKKTSFVPSMLLKYSFLGVVPACAAGVAACSSSHDVALAMIAFDAADAEVEADAPADTKVDSDSTIVALADIGFRSDTTEGDANDAAETGSFGVADVGFGG